MTLFLPRNKTLSNIVIFLAILPQGLTDDDGNNVSGLIVQTNIFTNNYIN